MHQTKLRVHQPMGLMGPQHPLATTHQPHLFALMGIGQGFYKKADKNLSLGLQSPNGLIAFGQSVTENTACYRTKPRVWHIHP